MTKTSTIPTDFDPSLNDYLLGYDPDSLITDKQLISSILALVFGGTESTLTATVETTASTSYTALPTPDTCTVDVGETGVAIIVYRMFMSNTTANAECYSAIDVSGANTIAPNNDRSISLKAYQAGAGERRCGVEVYTGLAPGSTTFSLKYKVADGGGGSGTATFFDRRISAVAP